MSGVRVNNRRVLKPYSDAMKNLLRNGYKAKLRPSGHDISDKFGKDRGGAIPPNIIDGRCSTNKEETSLAKEILANADNTSFVNQRFAAHILNNLSGMALLKAIDAVNARGEEAQLEPIAYELQERGYIISPSGTYLAGGQNGLECLYYK